MTMERGLLASRTRELQGNWRVPELRNLRHPSLPTKIGLNHSRVADAALRGDPRGYPEVLVTDPIISFVLYVKCGFAASILSFSPKAEGAAPGSSEAKSAFFAHVSNVHILSWHKGRCDCSL